MTGTELEMLRARLKARRRLLLTRHDQHRALVAEELESREIEPEENAAELWDARVLDGIGDAELRAVLRITAALRRLEDGRYGRCVDCGDEIEPERLLILPESERCLGCAILERATLAHA